MAAFPSTPTNGQQATVNGVTYSYDSTNNSWRKITSPTVINTRDQQAFNQANGAFTKANSAYTTANTKTTLGKSIAMTIVFGG